MPKECCNDQNRYSDVGLFWALSCDRFFLKVPMIPLKNSLRPTSNDRSLMSTTTEVIINLELQYNGRQKCWDTWGWNSIFECLGHIFLPSPRPSPKQCRYFYFLDGTDHSTNAVEMRGRDIRDLTLDANKLEQMQTPLGPGAKKDGCFRRLRKASFPKPISTTFVAHCSLIIYEALVRSQSIVHTIKF